MQFDIEKVLIWFFVASISVPNLVKRYVLVWKIAKLVGIGVCNGLGTIYCRDVLGHIFFLGLGPGSWPSIFV